MSNNNNIPIPKVVQMACMFWVIYLIQFILMPMIFSAYYPRSNEATFIFLIPIGIVALLGVCYVKANLWQCVLADLCYALCMCIYHGEGFYGIGLRGIALDESYPTYFLQDALITIGIILIILIAFQALIRGFFLAVQHIKES